ncbi:hypothetical protein J7U46_22340 [Pelomonas sp. V22]|uniref:hypothetical protein n=1 Tax=Pelomonas sp. V22 TaxID=2822139 RepID=UPI0024A82E92|nr:hypothetical protein [Pelomonas sp. V22]MDI4635822.1 hypothetical protein [Pelomonas sp. V22]
MKKSLEEKAKAAAAGVKRGVAATGAALGSASGAMVEASKSSAASVGRGAVRVGSAAKAAASTAGEVATSAVEMTKRSVATVATAAFDQNGDGQLDQEDLKILTEKGVALAKVAAVEVGALAKSAASSPLVKDTAAAAAVGAAIAVPVPLVGPAAGAVVGAAIGAYAHITKK